MSHTKVYLDTSVISALFDERTPERKAMTQTAWSRLMDYEICVSELVKEELSFAQYPLRERLLAYTESLIHLPVTDEAIALAQRYVQQGIFPDAYLDDAIHVAIASVHGIPYLLSWNFKHLVKVKTRRMVALTNTLNDYPAVEILAPPEL